MGTRRREECEHIPPLSFDALAESFDGTTALAGRGSFFTDGFGAEVEALVEATESMVSVF